MSNSRNNPQHLVENVLAVVLTLAASLKAYDLLSGANHTHNPPLLLLIASELLLALWLVVGGLERPRFLCTSVCFSLFSLVAFHEAAQSAPSCGCFGHIRVPPAVTGTFDLFAVMALWLTRPGRARSIGGWARRTVIVGASVVLLFFTVAFTFAHSHRQLDAETNGQPVVLDPASWINQPFPLADSIDGGAQIKSGRWLLILYHFDCDDCRHAIPLYRAIAQATRGQADRPHVAFIAIPPIASAPEDPGYATSDNLHFALRSDRDWVAQTPVVVSLRDGRVVGVTEAEPAANPPIAYGIR